MREIVKLDGRVTSGKGKAGLFLSLHEYGEFVAKRLGYKPYPGTLNVIVDPEEKEAFLSKKIKLRLNAFEQAGKLMGGITAYPVKFQKTVPALLVVPDKTAHPAGMVEVVAVANLRLGLKLKDGSKVVIQ